MEDDDEKKEKGDQNDCRQVEYAGNSGKKLREEEIGPKAKHQNHPSSEKPEDGVFFPKTLLSDQLKSDKKQNQTENTDNELNLD
jgi:hypothetical protein